MHRYSATHLHTRSLYQDIMTANPVTEVSFLTQIRRKESDCTKMTLENQFLPFFNHFEFVRISYHCLPLFVSCSRPTLLSKTSQLLTSQSLSRLKFLRILKLQYHKKKRKTLPRLKPLLMLLRSRSLLLKLLPKPRRIAAPKKKRLWKYLQIYKCR